MVARRFLLILAVLVFGCDSRGPDSFATFMLNGQSHTYSPCTYSRAGDESYLEAPDLKVVSGQGGVSGHLKIDGQEHKIVRGSLTLQSLKDKVAQGNLELFLDGQPPIEVRGSFKARSEQ